MWPWVNVARCSDSGSQETSDVWQFQSRKHAAERGNADMKNSTPDIAATITSELTRSSESDIRGA